MYWRSTLKRPRRQSASGGGQKLAKTKTLPSESIVFEKGPHPPCQFEVMHKGRKVVLMVLIVYTDDWSQLEAFVSQVLLLLEACIWILPRSFALEIAGNCRSSFAVTLLNVGFAMMRPSFMASCFVQLAICFHFPPPVEVHIGSY